jgi:formiminotetrahydrofolate cyclodeaminase
VTAGKLAEWTLDDLRRRLASPSPQAGGGTAALAAASMGAALLAMAAAITLKTSEPPGLAGLRQVAVDQSRRLLELAEADGRAYAAVLEARRMPGGTPEQSAERARRLEEALLEAVRVPLEAAQACRELMGICERFLDLCKPSTHSDLAVAAQLLYTGIVACLLNLRYNLRALGEVPGAETYRRRVPELRTASAELLARVARRVEESLL